MHASAEKNEARNNVYASVRAHVCEAYLKHQKDKQTVCMQVPEKMKRETMCTRARVCVGGGAVTHTYLHSYKKQRW